MFTFSKFVGIELFIYIARHSVKLPVAEAKKQYDARTDTHYIEFTLLDNQYIFTIIDIESEDVKELGYYYRNELLQKYPELRI